MKSRQPPKLIQQHLRTIMTNSVPSRISFYIIRGDSYSLLISLQNDDKGNQYRALYQIPTGHIIYYRSLLSKRTNSPVPDGAQVEYIMNNWKTILNFSKFPQLYINYENLRRKTDTKVVAFMSYSPLVETKANIALRILSFIKSLRLSSSNNFCPFRIRVIDFIKSIEVDASQAQCRDSFLQLFDFFSQKNYPTEDYIKDFLFNYRTTRSVDVFNPALLTQRMFEIILSTIGQRIVIISSQNTGKRIALNLLFIISSYIECYRQDKYYKQEAMSEEFMAVPKIFKASPNHGVFTRQFYYSINEQLPFQLKRQQISQKEILHQIDNYYKKLKIPVVFIIEQVSTFDRYDRSYNYDRQRNPPRESKQEVQQLLDRLSQYNVIFIAKQCPFTTKNSSFMYRKIVELVQGYHNLQWTEKDKQAHNVINNLHILQFQYSQLARIFHLEGLRKKMRGECAWIQNVERIRKEFQALYCLEDVEQFCSHFGVLRRLNQCQIEMLLSFERRRYEIGTPILPEGPQEPIVIKQCFTAFFKDIQKQFDNINLIKFRQVLSNSPKSSNLARNKRRRNSTG